MSIYLKYFLRFKRCSLYYAVFLFFFYVQFLLQTIMLFLKYFSLSCYFHTNTLFIYYKYKFNKIKQNLSFKYVLILVRILNFAFFGKIFKIY